MSPSRDAFIGVCPHCGKRRYLNRRDAKAAARRQRHLGHMSPYPCAGGYWHIGHLLDEIRRGAIGRDVYRRTT